MKLKFLNIFAQSILAGVCISIGTIAYVNNEQYVGAVAFSIGLLAILLLKLKLFTGIVPYMTALKEIPLLLTILLGNLVGCCTMFTYPSETSLQIVNQKMQETPYMTFIDACLCGILIFIAVEAFKKDKILIVILSVFTFIICGFEHSIADACYIISARRFDAVTICYFLAVVAGNAVGPIVFRKLVMTKDADKSDRKRLLE